MQGDPIAIGLYALGITPLMTAVTSSSESMHHSTSNPFYKVTLAYDFTVCGKLKSFNPTKTWLIVKDHELVKAFQLFAGTRVKIMSDGRRHFGGVVGTDENKKSTSTKKRQVMRRNRSFVQLLQQQNLTHIHHYIHCYKTLLRAIISKYFTKFKTTGKKHQKLLY